MLDLNIENVEVEIKSDGSVIWINTGEGCVLRISSIKFLRIIDNRIDKEQKQIKSKGDNYE